MPLLGIIEVCFMGCSGNGFEALTANRVNRVDPIIEAV